MGGSATVGRSPDQPRFRPERMFYLFQVGAASEKTEFVRRTPWRRGETKMSTGSLPAVPSTLMTDSGTAQKGVGRGSNEVRVPRPDGGIAFEWWG